MTIRAPSRAVTTVGCAGVDAAVRDADRTRANNLEDYPTKPHWLCGHLADMSFLG